MGNFTFAQDNSSMLSGEEIDKFLARLYNFNLVEADSLLEEDNESFQFNILSGYLRWYELLTLENKEEKYDQCMAELDQAINKIQEVYDKKDPERELLLVLCYSFKARLALQEENLMKGLNNLVKITNRIEPVLENQNKDGMYRMVAGLYYYFAGYISQEYPLLRVYFAFKPKGNTDKGLDLLKTCSLSANFFIHTEANYFLMKIYNETEKRPEKAKQYALELINKHPDNLIFLMYTLEIDNAKNNQEGREELIMRIDESIKNNTELSMEQKDYLTGLLNGKRSKDTTLPSAS